MASVKQEKPNKTDILLENFKTLYNESDSIFEYDKRDNDTDKLLRLKTTGHPVHLVDQKEHIETIVQIPEYLRNYYCPFFEENKYFWLIPIETVNLTIVGFILRAYLNRGKKETKYRILYNKSNISPMFGFYDFKDYEADSPIILTEGMKDSLYVKTVYPYTLSVNTSGLTVTNLEIIKCLTNKIIIIYDNDDTGRRNSKTESERLSREGISNKVIVPWHKDAGEYISDNLRGEVFKRQILSVAEEMGGKK